MPAAAALAWSRGELTDRDLLLGPMAPEIVFCVDLPDLASARETLTRFAYWRQRGAVGLIARTGHPVVDRYLTHRGAVKTWREEAPWAARPEDQVKHRLLVLPEDWHRWVGRYAPPVAGAR